MRDDGSAILKRNFETVEDDSQKHHRGKRKFGIFVGSSREGMRVDGNDGRLTYSLEDNMPKKALR